MSVQLIPQEGKIRRKFTPPAEASGPQGMGSYGQRNRGGPKAPDPSSDPLSVEEGLGAGSPSIPERQEAPSRSSVRQVEAENRKLKEALALQTQELISRPGGKMNLV